MALNCPRCGATIAPDAATCSACGAIIPPRTSPSNVIAALSYVGFAVTGILFLLIDPYRHDEQVRFHARQSIALTVAWFAFYIIMSVLIGVMPRPLSRLFSLIADLGYIGFAILWLYLIYQAYTGKRLRVPILGDWAEAVPL